MERKEPNSAEKKRHSIPCRHMTAPNSFWTSTITIGIAFNYVSQDTLESHD